MHLRAWRDLEGLPPKKLAARWINKKCRAPRVSTRRCGPLSLAAVCVFSPAVVRGPSSPPVRPTGSMLVLGPVLQSLRVGRTVVGRGSVPGVVPASCCLFLAAAVNAPPFAMRPTSF